MAATGQWPGTAVPPPRQSPTPSWLKPLAGIVVIILVLAVLVVVLSANPRPAPVPDLRVAVEYEADGRFEQRECQTYNATLTFSTDLPGPNFTVHEVTLNYDNVTMAETTGLGVNTSVSGSVTFVIDTCRGISTLPPAVCVDFEVTVTFRYSVFVDSRLVREETSTETLASFEICG